MKISFNDLNRIHTPLIEEFTTAFKTVLDDCDFIGGELPKIFEKNFSQALGVKHTIAVSNGTDAISVALRALNLPKDCEVITVANSWISSAEVITENSLKVKFVDTDETGQMSIPQLKETISSKTKVIIAVHLHGNMSNILEIQDLCKEFGLFLIEDCAQAHFSQFDLKNAGTFGDISTFSFYPGKNLGALGDSGAICTNNDYLAENCRAISNHGALVKHQHTLIGTNARPNPLMCKILDIKLKKLEEWTKERKTIAEFYIDGFKKNEQISFYKVLPNVEHTYHVFSILTPNRDELLNYLNSKGIQCAIHYPTIIPDQECYKYLNNSARFENARLQANTNLSLPIFPKMREEEVDYVIKTVNSFFSK